jgi:hypothetical protein
VIIVIRRGADAAALKQITKCFQKHHGHQGKRIF